MPLPVKRILKYALILGVIITAAKILFVGYDIDEQYAVTMSCRMLQGDHMLLDLWEPHQTSGFLCALLMLPYLAVTGSTFGIFLYLRAAGLLIHSLITWLVYRRISRIMDSEYALLICCIYFFSLPKLMFLPEFSNMQIWFLTLTLLSLLPSEGKHSLWRLVPTGIFLSLEVLSYPSAILVFFACLFLFWRESPKGGDKNMAWKKAAVLTGTCLGCAALFTGYLLSYLNISELPRLLSLIASDGSHSASLAQRLQTNLFSLGEIACYFILYAAIASVLSLILARVRRIPWSVLLLIVTLLGQVCIWLFGGRYPNYPLVEYFFVPLLFFFPLLTRKKACGKEESEAETEEKSAVRVWVLLPLAAFAGIVLFTNHPLLVSAPFLGLTVTGILICMGLPHPGNTKSRFTKSFRINYMKPLLVLWAVVLLFGKCYLIRTTGGQHYTVFDPVSLIREGPAAGILADRETVRRYRDTLALAADMLPKDAKVFYAGVSADLYLMKDLQICTPSTISSPTFDEKVEQYFAMHPDKTPEYIICDKNLTDFYTDSWLSRYLSLKCDEVPVGENNDIIIYSVLSE